VFLCRETPQGNYSSKAEELSEAGPKVRAEDLEEVVLLEGDKQEH